MTLKTVEMISLRKFSLASLSGHIINFEPNTPVHVPVVCMQEAMSAGCVPTDQLAAASAYNDDVSRPRMDFSADIRRSLIYLAIDNIVKDNKTSDFDASGMPHRKLVGDRVGFEVHMKEMKPIWEEHSNIRSNGGEFKLHKDAHDLLRVIDATAPSEVAELAEEYGDDPKKYKGLTLRECKRQLITRFTGAVVG